MTEPAPARPSQPIRVLLVDDHGMVRRGLRGYLELLDDILGKLGLSSRTQAALYAVEHGLVPPA